MYHCAEGPGKAGTGYLCICGDFRRYGAAAASWIVCYIIRKALEDKGWGACGNIMGFFFLPDVVTSKPEVAAIESSVAYNHSNGYAAMKELDYLMGLKTGDDWFEQNYGNFQVRTQDPPVDLCHLVSATRADGSVLSNGFGYGVHVASDYVMAYLADVELGGITAGAGDGGLTMRGHLSNVNNGVSQLARRHGASLSYHVLGASNAEIPMTQITTYLASGFYRRFQECVGRNTVLITKAAVDDWAQKLGLTADSIYDEVVRETDHLFLPEIERRGSGQHGPHAQEEGAGVLGNAGQRLAQPLQRKAGAEPEGPQRRDGFLDIGQGYR